ncbi:MAG: hypothetical protein MUO82_10780 [Candidatus Thermoplasmatota archaeon]|nr:hypothetical protein [Candidatus Thermoplasmatota archaeon]
MKDLKIYKPIKYRIKFVNKKYDEGNYIYLLTAREKDGTEKLLNSWGLKYNEIVYGKPKAHIYIDDSAENSKRFFKLPYYFSDKFKAYGNKINKKVRKCLK